MTLALIVWLVMTVFPAMIVMAKIMTIILVVSGVLFLILWGVSEGDYDGPFKFWVKSLKWALPITILLNLVPNTQTSWYMVGAYAAESIVTSETAKEIGNESKDLLLELIKRAKEEISSEGGEVPAAVEKVLKGKEA